MQFWLETDWPFEYSLFSHIVLLWRAFLFRMHIDAAAGNISTNWTFYEERIQQKNVFHKERFGRENIFNWVIRKIRTAVT